MATPQPLLKPQFQTSVTAYLIHTYEVMVAAGDRGLSLSPRHRVAYTAEDAVLALAQMLKANHLTPDDLVTQFHESKFIVALRVMLTCDGVVHEQLYREHKAFTHDIIMSKLRTFYPDARPMVLDIDSELAQESSAPIEDVERMSVLHNTGSQGRAPERRKPEPPKQRRVITTYQGNDAEEQMGEVLKGMIPEDIPKGGVILTTGKHGVRMVDASRSHMTEDEGYVSVPIAMNDTRAHSSASQEVTIHRDPNTLPPGVPDPRQLANVHSEPVKKVAVRTITGDEAENMVVKPLTLPTQKVVTSDGQVVELSQAQINQLMARQMGGVGAEPAPAVTSAEALLGEEEAAPEGNLNNSQAAAKASHKVKVPKMRQEGRGGVRPKKGDLPQ